jgi:surface antigen
MKHANRLRAARGLVVATLALSGSLALHSSPASAACGGGPFSTSPGNLIGSVVGGATGGLIGNQIGHGSGKGVATGLGVVGGALAGGYVGRSIECTSHHGHYRASRNSAAGVAEAQTCRFVLTHAVIDGNEQQVDGIACLDPADGTWKTASGPAAERAAEVDLLLRAQQQLQELGFYVRYNPDGRWGPATRSAITSFQRANGLASTGQLDVATRSALGLDPAPLEAGSTTPSGEPTEAGATQ